MGITKQTDLQEKFLYKQYEITRLKRIYYDADEKLVLPKHHRNYYDWLSSQYNSYPMEKKLRDLGFLITKGFDLKRSIRDYKEERDEYITSAIPQTFIFYILFMRYGEYAHFTEIILAKLSERQLINLFIDEISIRYNSSNLVVETGGWKDEELLEAAGGDKERFFKLIAGVELTKKMISSV